MKSKRFAEKTSKNKRFVEKVSVFWNLLDF